MNFYEGKILAAEVLKKVLSIKDRLYNKRIVSIVNTRNGNILYYSGLCYCIKKINNSLTPEDIERHKEIFEKKEKPLVTTYILSTTDFKKELEYLIEIRDLVKDCESATFIMKYNTTEESTIVENIGKIIYDWAFNNLTPNYEITKAFLNKYKDLFIEYYSSITNKKDGNRVFEQIIYVVD